jgi:hypothetical protein
MDTRQQFEAWFERYRRESWNALEETGDMPAWYCLGLIESSKSAWQAATKAEREACIAICHQIHHGNDGEHVANEIRARDTEQGGDAGRES